MDIVKGKTVGQIEKEIIEKIWQEGSIYIPTLSREKEIAVALKGKGILEIFEPMDSRVKYRLSSRAVDLLYWLAKHNAMEMRHAA
jgi:hypothetical protein